jgi:hypothetical protein
MYSPEEELMALESLGQTQIQPVPDQDAISLTITNNRLRNPQF